MIVKLLGVFLFAVDKEEFGAFVDVVTRVLLWNLLVQRDEDFEIRALNFFRTIALTSAEYR